MVDEYRLIPNIFPGGIRNYVDVYFSLNRVPLKKSYNRFLSDSVKKEHLHFVTDHKKTRILTLQFGICGFLHL
jgi:hypothetical protein